MTPGWDKSKPVPVYYWHRTAPRYDWRDLLRYGERGGWSL